MATKSVTFWTPQNVPGPQNTYFGAGILKIRLILKMRFQNLKNIKKMEPVLLKILCRLEYTLLQTSSRESKIMKNRFYWVWDLKNLETRFQILKIRVPNFGNWKLWNFKEHRFRFFDILQILEPDFQNFHILVPEYWFWGLGTFWGIQKVTDLVAILKMFY